MVKRRPQVSMLRLQATPTCNLNCRYCYIPESVRRRRGSMSADVLEATLSHLVDEDLLGRHLAISWHGAEPLAAGLDWYRDAVDRVASFLDGRTLVTHVFQSNGVLVDDDWCEFFRRIGAHVGISIDGTREQSAARVNWAGRPAFDQVMRGVGRLNAHGIPWTLLAVVGSSAMSDPESFVDFVRSSGCSTLGFKVEETNVANRSALHGTRRIEERYRHFVQHLWRAFPADGPVQVREFEEYRSARGRDRGRQAVPVTMVPLRNLTVALNGDFTIFSGELLFGEDRRFVFGNVLTGSFRDSLCTERFRAVSSEMLAGARRCAGSCPFYVDCGSFYVSQKLAEHGTFDAAETLACRLEMQTLFRSLDALMDEPANA